MADNSTQTAGGLSADSDAIIPRLRLSEAGWSGLKITNKQIIEEANALFRYPAFFTVVREMRNDPTVAAAFNVYKMLISRVKWTVEPPIGATEQQKARAKFVEQCMTDMETSWGSFINEVLTYLEYGHSVQEKVFRRRLKSNGSRYNDGLVGLRKLAPRAQETIKYWYFSDDGRDLTSIGQSLSNVEYANRFQNLPTNEDGVIEIPREKFLLFTADATKSNPQGRSLLQPIYLAYKRMQLLQEQELTGVAKDTAGIPLLMIPPKYMSDDASAAEKALYAMCMNIVDNIAAGTQRGIVFPKMVDEATKSDMFEVKLLDRKGVPAFDVGEIIKRYQHDILTALSVDVIAMGQDSGGSFSLADQKTTLLSLALSRRLGEMSEVLNTDLIPQLFALNGWTDEELPKFVPSDIEEVSLEDWSKYAQRVASVGLLELDRDVLNKVREVGGIKPKPSDMPVDRENLSANSSRSGDGLETGRSGQGTSRIGGDGSKQDSSTNNNDNKA